MTYTVVPTVGSFMTGPTESEPTSNKQPKSFTFTVNKHSRRNAGILLTHYALLAKGHRKVV